MKSPGFWLDMCGQLGMNITRSIVEQIQDDAYEAGENESELRTLGYVNGLLQDSISLEHAKNKVLRKIEELRLKE